LQAGPVVVVRVEQTQGSVPREVGAWLAVGREAVVGTIGGGHLEFDAIAHARTLLENAGADNTVRRYALGPSLGQCCGGVMHLRFSVVTDAQVDDLDQLIAPPVQLPIALFGGGHVGHAIVDVLSRTPVSIHWVDSRDEVFPDNLPDNVQAEHSDPVQAAVADVAAGSAVLIMSFSHAEDLEVVAACIQRRRVRQDLPYIGLIGSKSKWATFKRRLLERGYTPAELDAVVCPIGVPGIVGKEPEVIAISVAAQLLQLRAEILGAIGDAPLLASTRHVLSG
jgi:xanthine dehydrogenase accessory factor